MSIEVCRRFTCSCGAECIEMIDHAAHCWRTSHGDGEALFVMTLEEVLDSLDDPNTQIEGAFDRWLGEVHRYEQKGTVQLCPRS